MAIGRWRGPASTTGTVVVALAGAVTSPPGRTPLDALGIALLVIAGLSNAVRLRAPLTVLGVTVVAGLAYEARGYPGLAPMVPFLLALANAAWRGHRRPAMIAVAVMVTGGLLVQETIGSAPGETRQDVTQRWFLAVGWMVAAIVAGTLAARYQTYLAAVEQRAEEAERTREEVARRRADEERLRIARELHDSLTHSISIIKVQAGVAIHLARKRNEPVPEALVAIEKAGGEAMRELRATLEVLRGDEETGSTLDRLDHLVEGARQAGLGVQLHVTGAAHDLPSPVGRAAYRIIQEALTNVRRHAGPTATASVRLTYHPTELTVRVDNTPSLPTRAAAADDRIGRAPEVSEGDEAAAGGDPNAGDPVAQGTSVAARAATGGETGNGRAPAGSGVGLRGMRERVAALGGSLDAGPADGGGFRVHARLPLGAS